MCSCNDSPAPFFFVDALGWAATYIVGDFAMSCPARRTARWLHNFGHDAYLYYYTRESTLF